MLALSLFGSIIVTRDGEPLAPFRSQSELALLAYLAHTSRPQTREAIADLLWEARSTAQSLSNLRTVLSRLRKQLHDELVVTRKTLALRAKDLQQVDSVRLQQELQAIGVPQTTSEADRLKTALDLYTGDFLAGFYLADAPRFNEWVVIEQERLRQQVVTGLQHLIAFALAHGEPLVGIEAAHLWLSIDELSETAHTYLIHFLALNGQTNAALKQYDRLAATLDEELGMEPGAEATELVARIRRSEVIPLKARITTAAVETPHNLPRELTPFIGRQAERTAIVERLLNPACPMVTITGEGGIGKTRLALAVAREIVAETHIAFPDGVWFIPLAGLDVHDSRREAMATTIGATMGLSFHGERSQSEQLLTFLQDKICLILLDNFERLVDTDAVDLALQMLQIGSGVRLLATSRARLNLSAENIVRLAGLPVPYDDVASNTPAKDGRQIDASTYDGVLLFAERAGRTGEPFVLGDCTQQVVDICRYVAGVPLAIEMAAAWAGRMPCSDIAEAIANNLDFLSTRQRDVPARHRSMRAVFDYSWTLLNSAARQALAQASIFRGGFTQQAAVTVLGQRAGELEYLVGCSLLEYQGNGRYTLHEVLREFAAEKLAADDALDTQGVTARKEQLDRRHGAYFLNLVGNVTLLGEQSEASIAAAQGDLDNIRQAWRWAVSGPYPAEMATAWQGLWHFYSRRSLFQEGETVFSNALTALATVSPATDASSLMTGRLQVARATLLTILNRYDEAIVLAQVVLAYAGEHRDTLLLAWGHLIWGTALYRQGHFQDALDQLVEGLTIAQPAGLDRVEASIRRRIGTTLLEQGDISRARWELERALLIYRQAGMRTYEGNVLGDLGWLEERAHNYVAARNHLTAALAIQRELGNRHDITILLINLAGVSGGERHFDEAYIYLTEALENLDYLDDRYHRSLVNHGLGLELSRLGDYDQACIHYERSMAIDRDVGDESGLAWSQNNLGLLYNHLGNYEMALALHQDSLAIARKLHAQTTEGLALSRIGQDLYGLRRYDESATALQAAIAIQRTLDQQVWAVESNASLAMTRLALGQSSDALAIVEALLSQLEALELLGAREPFRVCWNIFCVLDALGDPRAADVLAAARSELLAQAGRIRSERLRQSYLDNIPSHRLIRQAMEVPV